MSDRDIDELFRRFYDLDRELKELRTEVSQLKWYQQHGTNGAVAYSTTNELMSTTDMAATLSRYPIDNINKVRN